MPDKKNMNKKNRAKYVRYKSEKRWERSAIKNLEKHLEKYDKAGKDVQARSILENMKSGTHPKRRRIRNI